MLKHLKRKSHQKQTNKTKPLRLKECLTKEQRKSFSDFTDYSTLLLVHNIKLKKGCDRVKDICMITYENLTII